MDIKKLLQILGFQPKENAFGIFEKKYPLCDNYVIEVDFDKKVINYGDKILAESKTTQNFSQPENFVVLECVNRLLEMGYQPENIVLEPTWKLGHIEKGRLDILVKKDDKAYLMIECKTHGKEYNKELKNLHKDGGQLFSYFQQDKNAEILMLYTFDIQDNKTVPQCEIIKIEEEYRLTASVKDFYEKWNKLTKNNGVWENPPYNFKPKALTIDQLVDIKHEDSSFIFNRFLEILRHNVVSDKPNAFNKIFNLFLCKIYDEKDKDGTNEELEFQWIEGKDNDISFQLRLTDLYKKGMESFLEKNVTDFSDEDFENQYASLFNDNEELKQKFKENVIYKLRLEKNNEFAIKEVYDEKSFKENAKVVKEIVQLLEKFKIRYTKKQQYLSDFFELLLTTGLKQESGQFFTPVPVAQFVIKSLPIDSIVKEKLTNNKKDDLLPYVIDYASGSGHFLTESMHEIQHLLMNKTDDLPLRTEAKTFVEMAKVNHFNWAEKYIYGVEKDYRLVKVGKVGCYLHGDGLANVIHSDGLSAFNHSDYKGKLAITDKDFPKENQQFDVIVSNPPYSVSAFKSASIDYYNQNDFELYDALTDNSSEIEALFIERTKQLLKDGGVAGVILPSSILSNAGIYTKAREIILQHFEIVAITELGSNTFMATGTNTVTLFLRRRKNYDSINFKKAIERFFVNFTDVTINGIEKPISKYIQHTWETPSFDDYVSLLKKKPTQAIKQHDIYKEYYQKIKAYATMELLTSQINKSENEQVRSKLIEKREKAEVEFWETLIKTEQEKLLYFVLAYPQKVVLIKSGQKDAEKRFLGYEFSNRRGNEGIHPLQRSKTIAECTRLFDENSFENPEKASTYIYKAFHGDFDFEIHESLQKHISRHNLMDMLTFDRSDFEKTISTSVKKKVKIESKWETRRFDEIAEIIRGVTYSKTNQTTVETNNIILTADNISLDGNFEVKKMVFLEEGFQMSENKKLIKEDIFICFSSGSKEHLGKVAFINEDTNYYAGGFMGIIRVKNNILAKYAFQLLNTILRQPIRDIGTGSNINNLSNIINEIKIPLPPLDIQQKIVSEIEGLEQKESKAKADIERLRGEIIKKLEVNIYEYHTLENLLQPINGNKTKIAKNEILKSGIYPVITQEANILISGYTNNQEPIEDLPLIVFGDHSCTFKYIDFKFVRGADGTQLLKTNKKVILTKFLYEYLLSIEVKNADKYERHYKYLKAIKIPVPPLSEQQKIVSEIEKIEAQISQLENEIAEIPKQKEEVLKVYLN
ncbi:N-6 DNA methylase [Capnocytophaga canis]|uniref:N-6 DNA methylase n=2 Tax=Capnocytophaga canis TaxID=1848903 RepID=UPI00165F254E|nr:N-6 DNA methylase [Capnocytophaga canis]